MTGGNLLPLKAVWNCILEYVNVIVYITINYISVKLFCVCECV